MTEVRDAKYACFNELNTLFKIESKYPLLGCLEFRAFRMLLEYMIEIKVSATRCFILCLKWFKFINDGDRKYEINFLYELLLLIDLKMLPDEFLRDEADMGYHLSQAKKREEIIDLELQLAYSKKYEEALASLDDGDGENRKKRKYKKTKK